MWHQGARTALVLTFALLSACSAKTLDITGPDAGTGDSGGGGGTGGTTGDGGSAGPYVTNRIGGRKPPKIDLLFMIDNSSSMADTQVIVGDAVPDLVDRLIEPLCIDPGTGRTVGAAVNHICAVGVLAIEPVTDIHIGVISSSLGAHGASGVCDDAIDVANGRSDPHNNDGARLLTRGVGATSIPTYQDKGFLNYNPAIPGALSNAAAVAAPFTTLVKGVGQHGCGYSASLEAPYRFLVDPEPYNSIVVDTIFGGGGIARLEGIDQTLLQQRADFLRPDSLVSVVLVTDENDCSIVDGGQGFYALLPPDQGQSVLPRGTSKCLENPNDPCCFSCGALTPPAGCAPPETDPECQKGARSATEDPPSLRCFNQKRRYGQDFLYPVQRYIDGFSKLQVPNRKGEMVNNPLFSDLACPTGMGCSPPRDKSLVWVTGLVGVPWQDIAVDPRDLTQGYKTAKQLGADNVWANIVGDPPNPNGPIAPSDPHMIESITPRTGLPGPGSALNADPIHGHEWDPSKDTSRPSAALQYACTFPLYPLGKTCIEPDDCDCFGPDLAATQKPVCQNQQGTYTNTQRFGKAYPGTRILQVLQGLGDQAIVGSICPGNVVDKTRDDYGYFPAVKAFSDRLRKPLRGECLAEALPIDVASGQTPCSLIEVYDGPCKCDTEPARRTAPEALLTDEMRAAGVCRCEIQQLTGIAQTLCRQQTGRGTPGNPNDEGWCYVDPAQQSDASCNLVDTCEPDHQRRIRFFTATSEPRPGRAAFLRCGASPITPLPPRCQ